MKIAVAGCGHGELEKIYATLARLEAAGNFTLDLLLVCGDFEAVRNKSDLLAMACPPKYRQMCDFHMYYAGQLKAPVLTLVIGGNHEASSYMDELRYGGWLAPNIYYLGTAGCVRVGDIRIAGISGIYKGTDYMRGRFETVPYDTSTLRSVYHIRALDVHRLCGLRDIDIMMSHDWPAGVASFGNEQWLLGKKPYFKEDLNSGKLGSPPTRKILDTVRPRYFFSAHLHVRFTAVVPHNDGSRTKFLALDKCLPNRDFLQVLDVPGQFGALHYDATWLCILKKTRNFETNTRSISYDLPDVESTQIDEEEISRLLEDWDSDLAVPENFEQTAPSYDPNSPDQPLQAYSNPQTETFLRKLFGDHTSQAQSQSLETFVGKLNDLPSNSSTQETDVLFSGRSMKGEPIDSNSAAKLSSQTPSGKTIKRRNASLYNAN